MTGDGRNGGVEREGNLSRVLRRKSQRELCKGYLGEGGHHGVCDLYLKPCLWTDDYLALYNVLYALREDDREWHGKDRRYVLEGGSDGGMELAF